MFDADKIKQAIKVITQQREHLKSIKNSLPLRAEGRTSIAQDIKSLDLAIETLETKIKIKPIKLINKNDVRIGNIAFKKGTTSYKCPVCGRLIIYGDKFCRDCGQGILWEMEA